MWDLFDGPADLIMFLGRVVVIDLFASAYILTCFTLAGWTQ